MADADVELWEEYIPGWGWQIDTFSDVNRISDILNSLVYRVSELRRLCPFPDLARRTTEETMSTSVYLTLIQDNLTDCFLTKMTTRLRIWAKSKTQRKPRNLHDMRK